MNSQPNEIITHLLSYLDNYTLMFARGVCHKWKHLIETRIFYKTTIPALHVCILTSDYYHFGKYYLDYNYDTKTIYIDDYNINDVIYYDNLVMQSVNKKNIIFRNIISRTNLTIDLPINDLFVYASIRGHLEVVKYLISIGADIHADGDGALRWSADYGHLEVIKYLINMGAYIHAENDYALLWSASNGHFEVVKYLISMGADIHADDDAALEWSAGNGHLKVVKYLISMGADIHANNDCALRLSAEHGHSKVTKYLISMGATLRVKHNTQKAIKFIKSISNKN